MTGRIYYVSIASNLEKYTERLCYVPTEDDENQKQAITLTQAQKIDTLCRAISNLTTNTYNDSYIDYTVDINGFLAE